MFYQALVLLNLKFRKKNNISMNFVTKFLPSFSPLHFTMPNGCLNWLRNQAGFRFSKLVSFLVWLSIWFDHKFLVRQTEMEKFSNKILVCTNSTIGFWVPIIFLKNFSYIYKNWHYKQYLIYKLSWFTILKEVLLTFAIH